MVLKGKQKNKTIVFSGKYTHISTTCQYDGNSINREVVEYHTYMNNTVNIVLHTNVRRATAARRAATASQTTTSLFVCYLRLMNQLIEIVLLLRTSRRCVTTFSLFFLSRAQFISINVITCLNCILFRWHCVHKNLRIKKISWDFFWISLK